VNNAIAQSLLKALRELRITTNATIDFGIVSVTIYSVSFDHGKNPEKTLLLGGTAIVGDKLLLDGITTFFGILRIAL